jgi:adenosylcobinamide kinase / adenosylcobinamide-phosphate guanylyltransferase
MQPPIQPPTQPPIKPPIQPPTQPPVQPPMQPPAEGEPAWADTDPTLPRIEAGPTQPAVTEDLPEPEPDAPPTALPPAAGVPAPPSAAAGVPAPPSPAAGVPAPPPQAGPPPTPPLGGEHELAGATGAARLDATGGTITLALPLRGRRVLVVGGGGLATEIAGTLCESGALVRVIAFTLSPRLTELADRGLIEVANRQYQSRDLADVWLAFACSEHRSVNAALAFDAEQARTWCVAPEDIARPPPTEADPSVGRRTLVLGGARSGKSAAAEEMLADCAAIDYIATGHPPGNGDREWDERVRRHRACRPGHWRTVETLDLVSILSEPESSAAVLIDCVATWLSQMMDGCGLWAGRDDADKQLAARLDELVQAWMTTPRRVVAVSNEVGSGIVPATESGRRFRDELGWLNTRLAATADEVWLCTAGIASRLK